MKAKLAPKLGGLGVCEIMTFQGDSANAAETIEKTIFLEESEVQDQTISYENEQSPLIKSNGSQIGDTNV